MNEPMQRPSFRERMTADADAAEFEIPGPILRTVPDMMGARFGADDGCASAVVSTHPFR